MINSCLYAGIATLINVLVGGLAAYALTRLRFPAKWILGNLILGTYLVPRALLFIPLFDIIKSLGIYDTRWAIFLTYPTFGIPFCTWLLSGFFKTIPVEIEECAMVDGCTRIGALIRIVIPLSIPGIIAATILTFTLSWNEFLYPLVFLGSEELLPVPIGVASMEMGDFLQWGRLMAAALLASVPVAIIYSLLQKYFIRGMTAGAVKG
jgi:multiple sugar transport system permease protein